MRDGWLKNLLRSCVKLRTKRKHDKYLRDVKSRGSGIEEFSLLSSDCIAGLIYHSLEAKFLSPTINMSINDSDFLKFLCDMEYYFEREIEFEESASYPVGYLGDAERRIQLRFEHYSNPEEAAAKWNERKTRMVDRCYVVMADTGLTDEEITTFKRLKFTRKVMFTRNVERADGTEIFAIKDYGKDQVKRYSRLNIDGFRDFERFFDYVSWLQMKEKFMIETRES